MGTGVFYENLLLYIFISINHLKTNIFLNTNKKCLKFDYVINFVCVMLFVSQTVSI